MRRVEWSAVCVLEIVECGVCVCGQKARVRKQERVSLNMNEVQKWKVRVQ